MTTKDNIFDLYAQAYESHKQHRMSLREFLEGSRADPVMYASTAERMITAIGEPEFVDTAKDTRLGRIFMNRTLKVYPAFKDFYGLEETIERIVGFFRHAAQGLEEKKQILYLLGPVGGGKSSLADRLEDFGQNDADAYSYSGGLNRTTQGVLEFVEMFKAPLKMLHPLLTATQDRTYAGTENVGAMPYQGLIIAHSNESEWQSFRANKNNEAFPDRISVIQVPY